eukprot:333863_1
MHKSSTTSVTITNVCHTNTATTVSPNLANCQQLKRIKNALETYLAKDADFSTLDIMELVNGFLYLLINYNDDDELEYIYNQLDDNCNVLNCAIFRRNCRNRTHRTDDMKNSHLICVEDMARREILDKIHCLYQHSFDIGYRLSSAQKLSIQESHNKESVQSQVFVKESSKQFQIYKDILISNHNKCPKHNQLYSSNIESELKMSDKMYSFGFKFQYRDDSKKKYPRNLTPSILVYPQHASLKEELVSNQISTISLLQFQIEYRKAEINVTSDYGKSFDDMSIECILCLMVYCNYTELQYQFSKTYRQNDGDDHKHFYFVGKNLAYAVQKHGKYIQQDSVREFYHGIGEQLLFPEFISSRWGVGGVSVYCPLSTSAQFSVALNFANIKGIVIQFEGDCSYSKLSKHFSTTWVSDFPHESEYLFLQNQYPLHIRNIYNVSTGHEFKLILNALKIIEIMTAASTLDFPMIDDELKSSIIIIFHKSSISSLNSYAQELIYLYCCNKNSICLNYNKIKHGSCSFLLDIFFEAKDQSFRCKKVLELFPNLRYLQISNIAFQPQILEELLTNMENCSSKLEHITLAETHSECMDMRRRIQKWQGKFQKLHFVTYKETTPIKKAQATNLSFLDEFKDFDNDQAKQKLSNLRNESSKTIPILICKPEETNITLIITQLQQQAYTLQLQQKLFNLAKNAIDKKLNSLTAVTNQSIRSLHGDINSQSDNEYQYKIANSIYQKYLSIVFNVIKTKCDKRINWARFRRKIDEKTVWSALKGYLFHNTPTVMIEYLWIPLLKDIDDFYKKIATNWSGDSNGNVLNDVQMQQYLRKKFLKELLGFKLQISQYSNPSGPIIQHVCWTIETFQQFINAHFDNSKSYKFAEWSEWMNTKTTNCAKIY